MKNLFYLTVSLLFLTVFVAFAAAQTTDEVTSLVGQTKEAISQDAQGTLAKINAGEHPYKDKDNPALYVFVLDTDLTLVGHFKSSIVGNNQKGKPDVKGKLYRDEFLAVAQKDGSGWVDYYFENPKTKKIEHKNTFVELAKGSDGKEYIVCSGMYYGE
jgi:polar amino acid transport system substrate-binding protein